MTEKLKTLKDFWEDKETDSIVENVRSNHSSSPNFCEDCVERAIMKSHEVIKAEAIKWVKDCKCESKVYNVDDKLSFINYCDGCERMIEFINITSEDLE